MILNNKAAARAAALLLLCQLSSVVAWFGGGGKKVLLKDVQALTLYPDKMTQGRRSSPVQQLECVTGGSASCSVFKPRVVQCINRGFDGVDVQWECKTDMDNNIRFGSVDVSCEGYEYPDDPYILAGSCGLRYNLDYTKEGAQQQHEHDYGYGGGRGESSSYGWSDDVTGGSPYKTKSRSMGSFTGLADLIMYCAMGLMAWAFYKTCISPSRGTVGDRSDSTTNDDYPAGGGGGGYGWNLGGGGGGGGTGGHGPNQGHRHDGDDASCRNRGARGASGGGGGGFWTGAATGGLLGYMFGNRGGGYNRGLGGGGYNRGFGGGGGWGGGGWGGGGSGTGFRSSSSGGSSGTRSASGFGGTSRR